MVPGRVLVERAHPDTAVEERFHAAQGGFEGLGSASAAGLDGEQLHGALVDDPVQRGVDGAEAFEDRDRLGAGRILRVDGHERLESVRQGYRVLAADLYLLLDGVHELVEGDRGRHGAQALAVVRVRVQEGEFPQAGGGFGVGASYSAGAEGTRIELLAHVA